MKKIIVDVDVNHDGELDFHEFLYVRMSIHTCLGIADGMSIARVWGNSK